MANHNHDNADSSTFLSDNELFSFAGSVGDWGENKRQDIIKTQILLGNAGFYDLIGLGGPTGWPGGELTRSLRRYQKDRGLIVDGIMLPDGETLRSLSDELGNTLAGYVAPTPEDADRHHEGRVFGQSQDEPTARSSIAMPDADGRSDHPQGVRMPEPGHIYSDEPPAHVSPKAGAQYAQVAIPIQPIPPAVDGRLSSQPGGPLPQDRPEVKAAARELERRLGYAKENATRWAEQTKDAVAQLPNLLRDLIPESIPLTPPSRPISEGEKAQTQTPPLIPSAPPEEPPSGRPREEAKAEPEQLIPPQLEEWVETFPQFDQDLLKQLLIVANSNGDEHTQLGNRIFIQEYLKELAEKYPDANKVIDHAAGGLYRGEVGEDKLKEEHLNNALTNGQIGSTRTDITFQLEKEIVKAVLGTVVPERHRINSQTMTKSGNRPTKREQDSEANLRINAQGQQVDTVPKLRPDGDGVVSDEKLASFRTQMRERAAEMIPRWIADLKGRGLL